MENNAFVKKVKAIIADPNAVIAYASAFSMTLWAIGYLIRAIKK